MSRAGRKRQKQKNQEKRQKKLAQKSKRHDPARWEAKKAARDKNKSQ